MYTVIKLKAGEVYRQVGRIKFTAGRTSFAVVDQDGNVHRFNGHDSIFARKATAQMEADYQNKQQG